MQRPPLEVADIIRRHGEAFFDLHGASVTSGQRRILRALVDCRTAALGGHLDECDTCHREHPSYNSCRNRHCPKCHASATADWLDKHRDALLPVPYFHVVFTIPAQFRAVALQNKRVVYGLLFKAASQTLLTIAADPNYLGAQIGFFAALHTWGQILQHHPHIHCLVPGGGIAPGRSRWVSSRANYFLPVKVLSRMFRGKFLALIQSAMEGGKLHLHGSVATLREPTQWAALVTKLYKKEWVVYTKPPFGGAESVLKYLARYTNRVAIANERLISLEGGRVTFGWKDYADNNRQRTIALDAAEFIRRFLLHELPSGFVKLRYYGFLANTGRTKNLELCRRLLPHEPQPVQPAAAEQAPAHAGDNADEPGRRCPFCQRGTLRFVRELFPLQRNPQSKLPGMDSS